jgi:hypothetical protein
MNMTTKRLRRYLIPAAVFIFVFAAHYIWLGLFPERGTAQNLWIPVETDWLQTYINSQNYWLGFSYGLSLAFAAYAIIRYLEERRNGSRNLAIGGVGFTGFLAVAGCFLLGCCGSPMLAVYISLFGAAFLSFIPFLKPLVALVTVISISLALTWMHRRRKAAGECDCGLSSCDSNGSMATKREGAN